MLFLNGKFFNCDFWYCFWIGVVGWDKYGVNVLL